eukprot:9402781-Alexandrium_andersonii.AAC.1
MYLGAAGMQHTHPKPVLRLAQFLRFLAVVVPGLCGVLPGRSLPSISDPWRANLAARLRVAPLSGVLLSAHMSWSVDRAPCKGVALCAWALRQTR